MDLCLDYNLKHLVHFPTGVTDSTANILDLILNSIPAVFDAATALDALSDHTVISSMHLSTSVSRTPQKCILLCNKANLEEINLEFSTFYDDCTRLCQLRRRD